MDSQLSVKTPIIHLIVVDYPSLQVKDVSYFVITPGRAPEFATLVFTTSVSS